MRTLLRWYQNSLREDLNWLSVESQTLPFWWGFEANCRPTKSKFRITGLTGLPQLTIFEFWGVISHPFPLSLVTWHPSQRTPHRRESVELLVGWMLWWRHRSWMRVVLQAPINSDVRNFEHAQSSGVDVSDAERWLNVNTLTPHEDWSNVDVTAQNWSVAWDTSPPSGKWRFIRIPY